MPSLNSLLRLSSENIIELIREHRNELIDKLLEEDNLRVHLSTTHLIHDASELKIEFITRALKELQLQPIDLPHYSLLILDIRKKDLAVISSTYNYLFLAELDRAIKNYLL